MKKALRNIKLLILRCNVMKFRYEGDGKGSLSEIRRVDRIPPSFRKALRRAEENSLSDPLTRGPLNGMIGNKEKFYRDLVSALSNFSRGVEGPPIVIMLDLDNFKTRINDALGHPKGDEALTKVADALLKSVREGDGVYRFGGDEFAVILKTKGTERAKEIKEIVEIVISRIEFLAGYQTVGNGIREEHLWISAGYSAASNNLKEVRRKIEREDAVALVEQADSMLYKVKRKRGAGR